jgi:phosphohistidine swiveling domain-containing protein
MTMARQRPRASLLPPRADPYRRCKDGREQVVITFDDDRACEVTSVGAKAANLATAARAGLPTLGGFTIPVDVLRRRPAEADLGAIRAAWRSVSDDGRRRVVVRSSAVSEDGAGSSMAGRFASVLAVEGWQAFLEAVAEVVESARVVRLDGSGAAEHHEMAVLVQPHLDAVAGGVLFGADPVTGERNRFVLAAVEGGPDRLVSGAATGTHVTLSRRGRVLGVEGQRVAAIDRRTCKRLAAMARHAGATFGGPQDIEWAVDADGALWLLQSRPVTTLGPGAGVTGPVLGPGPVAETFPDPLTMLEQDLWLEPLRAGIVHAVDLTGAVSRRRLSTSPVVVAVGGRAAVDLDLLGGGRQRGRPSVWQRIDPRPPARRLRAAWRTGRLRRAMPALARDLVARVDAELAGVGTLSAMSDEALADVLHGSRHLLVALHGQEVLAGLLLQSGGGRAPGAAPVTGASAALRALSEARRRGEDEARIVASHPKVLALVPPAVRSATLAPFTAALPDAGPGPSTGALGGDHEDHPAVLREALRLRARWVQELSALAAWELGTRMAADGLLDAPEDVRHLTLAALVEASVTCRTPELVTVAPSPPLPAAFRLDPSGTPVAVAPARDATGAGQGAGGGRCGGRVVHTPGAVEGVRRDGHDVVLITPTLAPGLAAVLPHVAGLVAETGSVLSHLAILARELGVATVVGVPEAATRFPAGAYVVVDGGSGTVEVVDAPAPSLLEHAG